MIAFTSPVAPILICTALYSVCIYHMYIRMIHTYPMWLGWTMRNMESFVYLSSTAVHINSILYVIKNTLYFYNCSALCQVTACGKTAKSVLFYTLCGN